MYYDIRCNRYDIRSGLFTQVSHVMEVKEVKGVKEVKDVTFKESLDERSFYLWEVKEVLEGLSVASAERKTIPLLLETYSLQIIRL